MPQWVSVVLARVLAPWVAAALGWLAVKYGVEVSDAETERVVNWLVGVILPLMLAVYGVLHKVLNRWLNPGDTASSRLSVRAKSDYSHLPKP